MLRLEIQKEGYSLLFKGEPLLHHGPASPCVHLGSSPPVEWSERERGGGRWIRRSFRELEPLRECRVLENGPERVVLNFGGRIGLEALVEGGNLRLSFAAGDFPGALRIDFLARPGDSVYGGGSDPRNLVDLSKTRLELWGLDSPGHGRAEPCRDWPLASFVDASRRWFRIEGGGWAAADFRPRGRISFEFSLPPESIRVGREESLPAALAALGRCSGRGLEPPAWTRRGPLVATRARGPALDRLLSGLEGAGLRPAGLRLLDLELFSPLFAEDSRRGLLRSRGLATLGLARPGASVAALLDASVGAVPDLSPLLPAAPLPDGLRLDLDELLAIPPREGSHPEALVSRRPLLLARALRLLLGKRLETGFFLSAARGCGMEEGMHGYALRPAPETGGLPDLVGPLLAPGFAGGPWVWLDPSRLAEAPPPRPSRRADALLLRRRAVEMAAFGPLLEFEPADPEDEEELRFLARMGAVFSGLGPYHEAVALEYRRDFLPPLRHCLLHYPGEAGGGAGARHYLYGRDLLIAVGEGRGDFASLDLPDDEWTHLWSSRRFRGGPVSIEAPLGRPAVFYRSASAFAPLFDGLRRELRRS